MNQPWSLSTPTKSKAEKHFQTTNHQGVYTEILFVVSRWDTENDRKCGCAEPCDSIIYSSYVLNRKYHNLTVPTSQLYVFYTTKVYSVRKGAVKSSTNRLIRVYHFQIIEELPGYDLSQFVADMGGSLGFLLGLSVLGLIGLFEKVTAEFTLQRPQSSWQSI